MKKSFFDNYPVIPLIIIRMFYFSLPLYTVIVILNAIQNKGETCI